MNKIIYFLRIILILIFLSFQNHLFSQNVYQWYQDGIIIFQLKTTSFVPIKSKDKQVDFKSYPLLNQFSSKYRINEVKQLYPNHENELLANTYQIEFDNVMLIDDFTQELSQISAIEYAEKKELHINFFTPNDTYFSNSANNGQWALFTINAQQAWDISTGSSSTVVAVTDNAINVNHPDLTNKMLQGHDAVDNDNDPTGCGSNDGFHGSHVSGIVGAETNNNLGIASIGYDVSILPVKIGDCNGSLTAGYEGIIWAADNGADVINMSWGGGGSSTYGQNVCNYAYNAGAIPIAAAGNDGSSSVFYPAGYNNVVSVASTTTNDSKSSFSNYGSWIDISAPGSSILSTNESSGYQVTQGTSMASPLVAGLVGLMKSYAPNATNTDLINCLYSSAANIDAVNSNYIGELGAGRIDAHQALLCLNAFSFNLDAAISSIDAPDGTICGSSIDPEITLRNYGSATLNSATIYYQASGSTQQTYNWTGNLTSGQSETIFLPNVPLTDGSYTFTAYSVNPNGSTDQNPANDQENASFTIASTGQNIDVTIVTDCYGSEVTWTISDVNGNSMANGGPYSDVVGGQTNSSSVCLVPDCYDFTINDTYGDGMYGSQWGSCTVDGDYYINDANGNNILQMTVANAAYGNSTSDNFCVTSLNIDDDASILSINQPIGTTCSNSIDPEVQIGNFGSQTLSSVDINYQISGSSFTFPWTGNLNSGQSIVVTLPSISLSNGLQNFTAYTTNPNGNTDQNPNNDTMQSSVIVYTASLPLPFSETFESNSLSTNNWSLENSDNSETWEIVTISGTTPGDKAAKINFFQYSQLGQRDALVTAPLNFNGYSNLDLTFEHAYKRYDQNSTDSLIVYISTDCGLTFSRLLSLGEDGTGSFATAYTNTASFTPTQTSDWCMGTVGADCFSVNLDSYIGNSNVIIKFESYNAGTNGNNLFLDNINIDGTANAVPPTADFNANSTTICEGLSVQFTDLSTSNITSWNWDFGDGNTSTQQNPTNVYQNAGTYTVTLDVSNTIGTDNYSITNYITVNVSDDATIAPVAPMCIADPSTTLSAATSGGVWSGNGVNSSGIFDPSISGIGTHTITYTTTGACSDISSIDIIVTNSADASIDPVSSICISSNAVTLTASTPGGTWSGTGITDPANGIFNPSVAGIGSFTVTYTISGSCGNSDVTTINVTSTLDASITSVGPYCSNDSPINLNAVDGGGIWTGNGISNSNTGEFDPNLAGPGTHVITYAIMGACGDISTAQITVIDAVASFTLPVDSICNDNAPITFYGTPVGGSWSGNGINSNGLFDPIIAGVGNHSITYTISGTCPDSYSEVIIVQESITAMIGNVNNLCAGSSPIPLVGTPSGGNWSGPGVNNNGLFDPSIAGVGSHNISYSFGGLCGDQTSTIIIVDDCSEISENTISLFEIIPNPNNGEFLLKIEGNRISNLSIEIFNQIGKIVYKKEMKSVSNNYTIDINITDLADGIYLIKSGESTRKFIKL